MSKVINITDKCKHYNGLNLLERLKELNSPGISIAIVENGNIFPLTYGIRNQSSEAITPNTLFQAGSLSKPLFAILIMRLVEKGLIDIDADISKHSCEKLYSTFDKKDHKITLRHILSHRAGFSFHGYPGYTKGEVIPSIYEIIKGTSNLVFIDPKYSEPVNIITIKNGKIKKLVMSSGMVLAGNTPLHLERFPNLEFSYSSGGYLLAQFIIEDILKKPFAELVYNEIFKPLDMQMATYEQPLINEEVRDFACGYYDDGLQVESGYNVYPELSAAGLWVNPSEYAKFCIEIVKAYNNQSDFLTRHSVDTVLEKTDEKIPIGLGVVIGNNTNGIVFSHNGGTYGYGSSMCFSLVDGTGIVIMQNSFNAMIISEIVESFKDVYQW